LRLAAACVSGNTAELAPAQVLFNYLCDEFKTKYKIDVKSNARASLRLRIQCEKSKKVLSSNSETPFGMECLMNDIDVKAQLTRELFEKLAEPLIVNILDPVKAAMADCGLSVDDITGVEIVGGASRLPSLCKAVEGFFGKPLRRTLNAAESVARGCALQGAMLSPTFHVTRRFEVEDVYSYPIAFSWRQSEEGPAEDRTSSTVFPKGNPIPSVKMLTFFRSGMFPLDAGVTEPSMLSNPADAALASFNIGPLPPPKAGGKAKLKVKVRLNLHGLVNVESAHVVEESEEEAVAGEDTNMDEADGADKAADGAAPMETTDAPKKKVMKLAVPVQESNSSLAPARLRELHDGELEMALQDRVMEETKERKNALEAYVLDMRTRLNGNLAPYANDTVKASFSSALQAAEDWLYDEGEDEKKSVYVKKLESLRSVGDPIEERAKEDAAREPAVASLRASAEATLSFTNQPQYAHVPAEQLDSVRKEAKEALAWLDDKCKQQAALDKSAAPALLAKDCVKKAEALERFAKPIFATPKPTPAPEPMQADPPSAPKADDLD